jgi:hypothetical protein
MIPRHSSTRKYRPILETLERKELCSAGAPAVGNAAQASASAPMSGSIQVVHIRACGTGTGTIIITK